MLKKRVLSIFRLCFNALIFVLITFLSSCDEDTLEVRDPCDFIRSINEVSLDISTACNECFFKFSFQGRVYDFRDDRIEKWFGCEQLEKCLIIAKNDFFEFKFKSLNHSSDLFASLNEQRALLTPDSLMQTDFDFFQQSFFLKDRCGIEYQVAKNTSIFSPDVSSSTLTGISVWKFTLINDGVNPPRYVTDYLISGTFSTQVLIGGKSESIGGSYALIYNVVEPL